MRTESRYQYVRMISFLLIISFISQPLFAHDVVGELEKLSKTEAAALYLKLGFMHILPLGFDHILFVLSLFLLSPKLKPVLWQATAFTVAHSITLGLAMFVHGLGFANALGELGLPKNSYLTSLVMFNVGVELGQLAVILSAFFLFGKWFGKKSYYRKAIVIPLSVLITLMAGYWTVERIFF